MRTAVWVGVIWMVASGMAQAEENRWWPTQGLPRVVVKAVSRQSSRGLQMLEQSVAGLAAGAVNRQTGDELVWVATGNLDCEAWYSAFLREHADLEYRGEFDTWDLVDRFVQRGLIKGYILYAQDTSAGEINDHRQGMNRSVNVATSLAGLLDGILIDESLEAEARGKGLKLLLDVRDKSQAWCFQNYQDQFHRRLLVAQDPRKPHLRDLAIAHRALVLYGNDEPTEAALKWLEPLSVIAGWNGGDEFRTTQLSSIYGHLQTATDWCHNLPVLMAGTHQTAPPAQKPFNPSGIDWKDSRSCVSFVLTDGDNVQWFEGSFFHGNSSFWNHPDRGKIPFGWSCCYTHLAQLCPQALGYAQGTQHRQDRMIEWGGGYYYPDHFGSARSNAAELLARHARRTWAQMRATGTRIIGFNMARVDSPAARQAYQTFAGETDGLLAILAFQYAPYEGGAGKTFWVKDRRGVEIPVISARYSIWEHANRRPRAGTPAKVAREIRDSTAGPQPRHDWVIVHAWSYFRRAEGGSEEAENLPQDTASAQGGVRGYGPAIWCAERLPDTVRVVTPEEMVWRIRRQHDPATTERLLELESGR
ncbi:MAG: hypothetical protein JSS02_26445 [Planctomycetes bacterium]|nr:hypothetical protein [Planctomycetota bacterium]